LIGRNIPLERTRPRTEAQTLRRFPAFVRERERDPRDSLAAPRVAIRPVLPIVAISPSRPAGFETDGYE
jgi:hypothetical protein